MGRNEFNVGEYIDFGLIQLKCLKQREDLIGKCDGCFLINIPNCKKIVGECSEREREDKQDVIFVKVQGHYVIIQK